MSGRDWCKKSAPLSHSIVRCHFPWGQAIHCRFHTLSQHCVSSHFLSCPDHKISCYTMPQNVLNNYRIPLFLHGTIFGWPRGHFRGGFMKHPFKVMTCRFSPFFDIIVLIGKCEIPSHISWVNIESTVCWV